MSFEGQPPASQPVIVVVEDSSILYVAIVGSRRLGREVTADSQPAGASIPIEPNSRPLPLTLKLRRSYVRLSLGLIDA
jgi:hypothetical protein